MRTNKNAAMAISYFSCIRWKLNESMNESEWTQMTQAIEKT